MSKHEYPRILVISGHGFNKTTGGGVTFSNLFAGWPKDALACVHNDPEPTTNDVCERFFVLGTEELDLAPPFDRLRRGYRASGAGPSSHGSARPAAAPPSVRWLARYLKSAAVAVLGDSFPERATLTPRLRAFIEDFKPDLIHTILGSNGMMRLIEQVAQTYQLRSAVHMMDDWPSDYHRRGLLGPTRRREMSTLLHRAFARASVHLGVSDAMRLEYRDRYGFDFQPFQNTLDIQRWKPVAKKDVTVGDPVDVLYMGSIFPNAQLSSLAACCRAAVRLNRAAFNIKVTICSPMDVERQFKGQLLIDPCVRLEPPIRCDEDFFRRISRADILLLPVNFDAASARFIRYSMPTKVPAYLAAGAPVLVYGPKGLAQVEYAREAKWGHVVDDASPTSLDAGLLRLIEDIPYRRRLLENARRAAARHDAPMVRERFRETLKRAATSR